MSYVLDACKEHMNKFGPIMKKADTLLKDAEEIKGYLDSSESISQFNSLIRKLEATIPEAERAQNTLAHRATRFDTTGYRVSYSGNDPLRINAADEYNKRQREHDDKERKDNISAVVKANSTLEKVEKALNDVEKFLESYKVLLEPYYYKKKEEERKKIEAEKEAERKAKAVADKQEQDAEIAVGVGVFVGVVFFIVLVIYIFF